MNQVEFRSKAGKIARSPMRGLALGICTVFLLAITIAGCAANGGGSSENPQSSSGTSSSGSPPKTPVSIAVTPANPRVESGKTQQMTATATYSDASTQDITASVTWSAVTATNGTLQNPVCTASLTNGATSCANGTAQAETAVVATITAGGLTTAVSATGVYTGTRTATVTATLGSVSGSTTLKYGPKPRTMHVEYSGWLSPANDPATPVIYDFEPNFTDDQFGSRRWIPFTNTCPNGLQQLLDTVFVPAVNQGFTYQMTIDTDSYHLRLPAMFSTSGLIADDTVQKGCEIAKVECGGGLGFLPFLSICYSRY